LFFSTAEATYYPDLIDLGEEYRSFSPKRIATGKAFSVRCRIQNTGVATAFGFVVRFYASHNTAITESDYQIGDDYVAYLGPSGSLNCSWSGNFPSGVPDGSYYVGWLIDADDDVAEAIEDNNDAYKESYKLDVGPFPPLKLFWQSDDGAVAYWALNDVGERVSAGIIGNTGYQIEVAGDVDRDGIDDLIVEHEIGTLCLWLLYENGDVKLIIQPGAGLPGFSIVASGDVDNDGTVDLIMRNPVGYFGCILLDSDGSIRTGVVIGGPVSSNWVVVASGDIDGNGTIDLFWRDMASGWVAYWMLNSDGTRKKSGLIGNGPVSSSWTIEGCIDVNGDITPDLLWRNASGRLAYWVMNPDGSRSGDAGFIGFNVDLAWQVQGTGDIDGDGPVDLIWRHSTTGQVAYCLIDPSAPSKRKDAGIVGQAGSMWH
jgi:hypothetical protein